MASSTLRVGADISEFQKATKKMREEISTVDSSMKASAAQAELSENKFKGLSDQQTLLSEKLKIASNAVETQKNYIGTLVEKQEKLKTIQTQLASKIGETTEKWEVAKTQYGKNSDQAKALSDQLTKLEKQQKNNDSAIDSNISKINVGNKKMAEAETQLYLTEKALKDVNKEVGSFKINEFSDNLGKSATKMKDLGGTLTAGITVPITAAVTGLSLLASKAIDNADSMQKMSDKTGLSAERLQELQYIGNNLGVDLDTISGAQAKLTKSMAAASDGTGTQAEAFSALGLSVTDSNGNLRDSKEVMLEAFEALNGVGNETQRDALAMSIFGKSAMELNPLIKAGADEMNRLAEEARKVGAVISNEDIAAMDAFGDSMDGVKMAISASFAKAFAELLPKLQELMPVIQEEIVPAIAGFAEGLADLIIKFTELPDPLQGIIGGAAGLTVVMGPLLMLFGGMAGGLSNILGLVGSSGLIGEMSGAAGATGGLSAAFTALTGPVGIAIAAVAAIGAVLAGAWQNSEIFRNSVGTAFESIKVSIQDAFARITEAMAPAMESFKGFSANIIPALQQLGDFLGNYIVPAVSNFIKTFINGFADIIVALAPFIQAIGSLLVVIWDFVNVVAALFRGDWSSALEYAKAMAQSFGDFLTYTFQGISNWVKLIFTGMSDFIKNIWNGISSFLQMVGQEIYNNTIGKISETAQGISEKWEEIKNSASQKWTEIRVSIEEIIRGLPDAIKGIASDMLNKMVEGIQETAGNVYGAVTGLVNDVITKFKEGFGINSPSTVLKEIGKFMIQGLINGLSGDNLMAFVNKIVESMKSSFSSGAMNIGNILTTLGSSATDLFSKLGINIGGAGFSAAGLAGINWGSPTGMNPLTENFPWDEDFGERIGSVGSQYHEGLDFNDTVGEGSPVYAIQDGVVSFAGYNGGYGNQIVIDFGGGIAASYSHLSTIGVGEGDHVTNGEYIGNVGNTGSSYGAHLHFGLLINGEYVDPMQLWSGASFDIGSRYVPEDMIAMIHKGEAIIPANKNPYINSTSQMVANTDNKKTEQKQPVILQVTLGNGRIIAEHIIDDINVLLGIKTGAASRGHA